MLRPGGLLIHDIWEGTTTETHNGLHDQRYTPDTLETVVPATLRVAECEYYQEMNHDSLRVILRPTNGDDDT